METTVTINWDAPQGSGTEAVVDEYHISILPTPTYGPVMNLVVSPPWNVTLTHNIVYTGNITAINCAGESTPLLIPPTEIGNQIIASLFFLHYSYNYSIVNCGEPGTPPNGSLGNYTHTREGAIVTYQCNTGYRPSRQNSSVCNSTGHWMPPPEQHVCTLFEGIRN